MYPVARNLIVVALLAGLAAATWILGRSLQEETPQPRAGNEPSAGYYLKNATLFGTDTNGRVYYRLIANEVRQSDAGDELLFHGLRVEYDPESEIQWRLTAAEGRAARGQEVLNLSNGVELTSTPAPEEQMTTIQTESLELDTTNSMATTQDPVVLSHGRTTFEATGLTADLSRDQLQLHSNVSATLRR
jgi:LPS export ABC transporter protein LptC